MSVGWWICTLSAVLCLLQKQSTSAYGATACSPPCLLVSNTTSIIAIENVTGVRPVISGLTRAVAIDVHFSLGYIFWSDIIEQNIKRFQTGGNTTVIITGIGVCYGLAVDWRSSQLYWTDATNNTISVSDLNGSNQRTMISLDPEEPRAIALDLDISLMIWTEGGSYPKIEKASLNGSQRISIVTTSLYHPNGIELDRGNKRVFWMDVWYDRVETVDYNGNNRKQLFQLPGLHPFYVTLIAPFLFFTDWNTSRGVHTLDATTGKVVCISYNINGGRPLGIVAYDYARQPPASSACAVNNGGCSHFCVTNPTGYKCVCPIGLFLRQDGKTCENNVDPDYDRGYDYHCPQVSQAAAVPLAEKNGYVRVFCPQLAAPPNGNMQKCNNFPGEICTFSCDEGYNLTGSKTRTCHFDRKWTGEEPRCNAVTCPNLLVPPNGKEQNCTTAEYNRTCQFSCNDGYTGIGSSKRTCLQNGKWDGQDFFCRENPGEDYYRILTIALGSALLVVLAGVTIYCVRKCYLGRRFKVREENIVHTDPAFEEWNEDGNGNQEFIIMEELGQDDVGFHDPYFRPVVHYESLYDAHDRSDNVINSWQSHQSMLASGTAGTTNNTDKGTLDGSSTLAASKAEDGNSDSNSIEEKTSSDAPSWEHVCCDHYDQPVTQKHCFSIKNLVGVYWKEVLRELSMDEAIIRNLEEDFKHCEVDEKCYQGLLKWKNSVGPQEATIKKLCDALRLVNCSEALKTLWKEDKRQGIRGSSTGRRRSNASSSSTGLKGGSSSPGATKMEDEGWDNYNQKGKSSAGRDDEPVTERQCFSISSLVGVSWRNVLRRLSMEEAIIRNIEEDMKYCEVTEKCYHGLLKWKESVGPQKATTQKLCDALLHVGCSEALKTFCGERK